MNRQGQVRDVEALDLDAYRIVSRLNRSRGIQSSRRSGAMDDASRGFIRDLDLRASERLLLRIGDKAHDVSRSNRLSDEQR